MIYFIDEDIGQIETWADSLIWHGYKTKVIRDANSAFTLLLRCEDLELVFIDLMLACSLSKNDIPRYTRKETEGYQLTGLLLLGELIQQRPDLFPLRSIILSQINAPILIQKVMEFCRKNNVNFWRKSTFTDSFEFADKAIEYLTSLNPKRKSTNRS